MPNLPIPPEYQALVAAIGGGFALFAWLRTYFRPSQPPTAIDLSALGHMLSDSFTVERAGNQIVAAIDRLTAAVEKLTKAAGRSRRQP